MDAKDNHLWERINFFERTKQGLREGNLLAQPSEINSGMVIICDVLQVGIFRNC